MNNNIYDISKLTSYQLDILNSLEDNEGEIIESDMIMIDDNLDKIKEQYQQLYYYIKNIQGEINTIKKEKNRLDGLIKRKERAIKYIKTFMKDNIKTLHSKGIIEDDKIKTNTVSIFLVKKDTYKVWFDDKDKEKEILDSLSSDWFEEKKEIIYKKPKWNEIIEQIENIWDKEFFDGMHYEKTQYVSWR